MSMADDIHDDDGAAVASEGMGGGALLQLRGGTLQSRKKRTRVELTGRQWRWRRSAQIRHEEDGSSDCEWCNGTGATRGRRRCGCFRRIPHGGGRE
jgi:hypothetical protein